MRQVSFQTSIGTTQTTMSEHGSRTTRAQCFLIQKLLPVFVPLIERYSEGWFINFCERKSNPPQLLCRWQFRMSSEIPTDHLHLVELAYLHRQVAKNSCHAWFPINHHSLNNPALIFQSVPTLAVHFRCLLTHFLPPEIAFEVRCAEHAHAVCSSPEGHVSGQNDRLRSTLTFLDLHLVDLVAYPDVRTTSCLC